MNEWLSRSDADPDDCPGRWSSDEQPGLEIGGLLHSCFGEGRFFRSRGLESRETSRYGEGDDA